MLACCVAQNKGGGPLGAWCSNSSFIMSSKGLILWWHAPAKRIWCLLQPPNLPCVCLTCLWMWSKWDWRITGWVTAALALLHCAKQHVSIFPVGHGSSRCTLLGQPPGEMSFIKDYVTPLFLHQIISISVKNTHCQKGGSWEPVISIDILRSRGCPACQSGWQTLNAFFVPLNPLTSNYLNPL